ncbi:hypothetical protein [Salana multivorans]
MSTSTNAVVEPIETADLPAVGEFLHTHLNPALSAADWARALTPTWVTECSTHGYLLRADGVVVGVYAAFYSEQPTSEGGSRRVCNLAAWCVLEEHRAHSLLLIRKMIRQRDRDLTDLSPSGAVVATNERLGFTHLDTSGGLVLNLPLARAPRGARVVTDLDEIAAVLTGEDRRAFEDHRDSPAVRHLAVVVGERVCWVVTRTVRRKRLPIFAAVVHVSDRALFSEVSGVVYRHLLLRGARPFTLVETRVTGSVPWHAVRLASQRPKMFRSRTGTPPESVTQLYSELTQVAW